MTDDADMRRGFQRDGIMIAAELARDVAAASAGLVSALRSRVAAVRRDADDVTDALQQRMMAMLDEH